MSKKKIVSLCLVLALLLTAAIGGTMAYFTDNEKETNVLTVGNVDINLEEYMQDENGDKIPFDSDESLTLYPMTDEQGTTMLANKIVDVYNTSPSEDDAYIRTIIAFESMEPDEDGGDGVDLLHFGTVEQNYTGIWGVNHEYIGEYTIDEAVYDVYVFTTKDKTAIPYGEKMQPLNRVWLDASATNDDMKALGEDGKMNILVVAQGVQVANFADHDAAFEATFPLTDENIVSWFEADDSAVINDLNQK